MVITTKESELSSKFRPYKCFHCNKELKNWQALASHLKGCPERKLKRIFQVGNFRYTLILNPKKKILNALKDLSIRYPEDSHIFLGAVRYLESAKDIDSFQIDEMTKPT